MQWYAIPILSIFSHSSVLQYEKYRGAEFGRCPRVFCNGQPLLPVGLHDVPLKSSVKVYCPKCEDIYNTNKSKSFSVFKFVLTLLRLGTDGCYFGTTFPHMFFLEFPELKPSPPEERYVPRVFGFKVHETSYAKSLEAKMKAKAKE
jgi:casein kinase II subunit beta